MGKRSELHSRKMRVRFACLLMLLLLFVLSFLGCALVVVYVLSLYQIIQRMSALRIEMRVGSPDEIPELDGAKLSALTDEMEALGFERVSDVVLRNFHDRPDFVAPIADPSVESPLAPTRLQPHILSRVMRHRQQGCLGIVSSMALTDTRGKRQPKTSCWVSFDSFAPSGRDNWSYSTTGYKASIALDKVTRVCCRPRVLWTRMPKATTAQMWDKHLARRQQIARAAQIEWTPNPTVEDYIAGEQSWTKNAREVYAQLTPFQLWNRLRQVERERKKPEWLGELKGKIAP